MKEQVTGYVLLVIGIGVMLYSVMQAYMLLTNQIKPFQVYATSQSQVVQKPAITAQDLLSDTGAITEMQTQLFTNIIEKELGRNINLGATLFFFYFIMLFGFRMSSLGVQLVRPIKVRLKAGLVSVDEEKKKAETAQKTSSSSS